PKSGARRSPRSSAAATRSSRSALPSRPCASSGSPGKPGWATDYGIHQGAAMAISQHDKAVRFQELHRGPRAFVIANPWDAGSARLLAGVGFEALATSSGAAAGILGRRDGKITRDEALAQSRAIVEATDLPVSADLEKGFGDAPAAAAETIRLAAAAGLVGGSIEDATGDKDKP